MKPALNTFLVMPRTFSPSMKWLKPPIFLLCLLPVVVLLLQALYEQLGVDSLLNRLHLQQDLGANPIEKVTHTTGDWILIFLCITLAVTPLRRILSQPWLIKFRRMFGLFAFFYACLHFLTYIWLDQFFGLFEHLQRFAQAPLHYPRFPRLS